MTEIKRSRMLQKVRTTMNKEINEKKATTLEDLLMGLVKEGKAVRIPIAGTAFQQDKEEGDKEQEVPKVDRQPAPVTINIKNLHIHLDERMTSYNSFQSKDKPEDAEEEEKPDIDVDEMLAQAKMISTVGTAMREFSSLAKGIRLLITHVGSASGVFGKLGAVLGGLPGPVVAVVAVIGTLVAAFMNLWNTNEEFRTAITGIWNDIVSKVKGFCDQLTQRINGLGFDFKDIPDVLKTIWDGFCQMLAPLFEGAFQNIDTIIGTVLDTLIGLFDVFSNLF